MKPPVLVDYPCDECGHEGPHTLTLAAARSEVDVFQCGSCMRRCSITTPLTRNHGGQWEPE